MTADDELIDRLRAALAAGPTPGPWVTRDQDADEFWFGQGYVQVEVAGVVNEWEAVRVVVTGDCDEGQRDAAYIAAVNPTAIEAVLARLDAVEAENRRMRPVVDAACDWLGSLRTRGAMTMTSSQAALIRAANTYRAETPQEGQ